MTEKKKSLLFINSYIFSPEVFLYQFSSLPACVLKDCDSLAPPIKPMRLFMPSRNVFNFHLLELESGLYS